jgi:hypothetical protein
VNETKIHAAWRTHGFVILPGYLSDTELAPAVSELDMIFPTADGFHDATDPRHERYRNDEFDGIEVFPFASTELSLLAINPRLVELAERLLRERDLRIYSAEAWAKYTGATNYEQDLHRDYLNHTVLVPTTSQHYQQLEMFVFLSDVPEELGPRTWFRSSTPPSYRRIPTSTLATAGMDHSWPSTITLTCTTWSSPEPDQPAPSSRSTSAPATGEPHSPSRAAPATRCICATGQHKSSGANGRPGPTAATHPIGTGSCTGRRQSSSSCSDSRRPSIPSGIPKHSWG